MDGVVWYSNRQQHIPYISTTGSLSICLWLHVCLWPNVLLEGAPPSLAGDNVLARSQTFFAPPPPPSFPTPTSNHKFPKNVPIPIRVNSLGQKMGVALVVQPFLLTVLMCTRWMHQRLASMKASQKKRRDVFSFFISRFRFDIYWLPFKRVWRENICSEPVWKYFLISCWPRLRVHRLPICFLPSAAVW